MKNKNPSEAILAISGGFTILYLIFNVKALIIIALCFLVVGLLSPYLTEKISWLWMGFAKGLGYINSHILLAVVFFLILTPLALLRKGISGKKKVNKDSYYYIRDCTYSKNDFEKPF